MSMITEKTKVVAFYLPQFHAIPENDKHYGKGFTEWTNTKKAMPLFEGHNQPRTPLNENYYCLLDDGVMQAQAELAKEYGVYGFCYYHYWFKNGKKLLEKPLEKMLKDSRIDIPFCLCWANENWSKRWDGGDNEVIVSQDYGDKKDLENHIDYLCDFFCDPRYIRIDDMPVLLIYKPELIPNLKKVIKTIRKRVKDKGYKGIKLVSQYPLYYFNGANLDLFDYYVQFQPKFIQDYEHELGRSELKKKIKKILLEMNMKSLVKKIENFYSRKVEMQDELIHRDYDKDWQRIIEYDAPDEKVIAGAFVDWDNTARNKKGLVYDNVSPEKFEKYMGQLVEKVNTEYKEKFIFINAWNEWAEGAYLEPDEAHGYAYLEALKRILGR